MASSVASEWSRWATDGERHHFSVVNFHDRAFPQTFWVDGVAYDMRDMILERRADTLGNQFTVEMPDGRCVVAVEGDIQVDSRMSTRKTLRFYGVVIRSEVRGALLTSAQPLPMDRGPEARCDFCGAQFEVRVMTVLDESWGCRPCVEAN